MEADGETPWEACRREVREEVGLDVDARSPRRGRLPAAEAVEARRNAVPLRLRRGSRRGARRRSRCRRKSCPSTCLAEPAGALELLSGPAAPARGRGAGCGRLRLPGGRARGVTWSQGRQATLSSGGRLPQQVDGRRRHDDGRHPEGHGRVHVDRERGADDGPDEHGDDRGQAVRRVAVGPPGRATNQRPGR